MTRYLWLICLWAGLGSPKVTAQEASAPVFSLAFYGDTLRVPENQWFFVDFDGPLSDVAVSRFYGQMDTSGFTPYIDALLSFKARHALSDWLYYQLLRQVAEQISPKAASYNRYTLYKWYLLSTSGYDATLAIRGSQLLFYVYCQEDVYDIPCFYRNERQYVCLNYHDFGKLDFKAQEPIEVSTRPGSGNAPFSYQVHSIPDFPRMDYSEKEISYQYGNRAYRLSILVNEQLPRLFTNYPVVDYASYLNIPLSKVTYQSLIPALKAAVAGMKQKQGIDYLMRFTRTAFAFETDQQHFGKEKRMPPELTLFYEHSDCDDRVALFYFLVKEIYDLPMLVLLYPEHVTIAVKLDKPVGKPILYNGDTYSVCEPTPQADDLRVGEVPAELKQEGFRVAYVYTPG